jgi:hypothetical protein
MLLSHARWDATNSKDVITWLTIAQARLPQYDAILRARLAEQPNDVVLLRMEQDAVTGAPHDAVCARHRQRAASAPDDPDLAYLASRCAVGADARKTAFLRAFRRWPHHPWLAMGVGYGHIASGEWRQAIAPLEQARLKLRPLWDVLAVDLARIHRLMDKDRGDVSVAELTHLSNHLQFLVSLENGTGFDSTPLFAYEALARGDVDDAVYRARADSDATARVLRLAAASDGASRALVQRALALGSEAGMDIHTRWVTIGLAIREGRDYRYLLKTDEGMSQEYTAHLSRFLDLARRGAPVSVAEGELRELPLSLRGLAYSVAVIVMGKRAPAVWRRGAARLLFASERPYFR